MKLSEIFAAKEAGKAIEIRAYPSGEWCAEKDNFHIINFYEYNLESIRIKPDTCEPEPQKMARLNGVIDRINESKPAMEG